MSDLTTQALFDAFIEKLKRELGIATAEVQRHNRRRQIESIKRRLKLLESMNKDNQS